MKLAHCLLILAGCLMLVRVTQAADLNEPVDTKLRNAYQRIRFGQQYPPDAAQFIQSQLQDATHPLTVFSQLAKDQRVEVRSLVALLLGEYAESEGGKILWVLTRDEFESVRLTAAGALARLRQLTPVAANVEGLRDERPTVRRLTASILTALADKGSEDALIDALKEDNALVRTDVVRALNKGACGTDRALPSLVELLHDPSVNVRDKTAKVLGGFHDPVVLDPLVNALKDPDWHVRAAAADSLGAWVKEKPSVVEALLRILEHDDFALVRDRTADALAVLGDDERVVPALVKALGAEQRDVRFHATQAIISGKSASALPLLGAEWRKTNPAPGEHDAYPDVREKIMDIFGRIGGTDQLPSIIEGTSDSEPQVQLAAVNALRRLKERGGAKQLTTCLTDKNPHVRAAAVRAIGDLGEKSASNKLLPLLRDESSYVRGAAAEALGKLGDRSAIVPLIQILTGEKKTDEQTSGLVIGSGANFLADLQLSELQTKTRAIEALGVLRSPEAVDPIIKNGLQAEDAGLRAVSAYALGQIRDPRAVEPLQAVVRNYYQTVATDLDYVIDPGVTKVADDARRSREKESRVRASVAWALGQIGDATAKETLLKAMNDQNSLVRDSAFEALAKIAEKEEDKKLSTTDGGKPPEKTP